MKKLICIDVDGTLVHGEYKITNEIRAALDACHAEKIIVSGRTIDELLKLNSGFDLIGSNGGEIYSNGEFSRKLSISATEAINLIKEVNDFGYYVIVHTDNGPIIEANSDSQVRIELEKILVKYNLSGEHYQDRLNHMFNHVYQRCLKVDSLIEYINANDLHINKLESHFELDKTELFNYLNENYNVEAFNSAGSNIEIVPKNALKGNAIVEYANGKQYKIIAIGDGDNDIPMFEVSDYKIAMGNGTENLKSLADVVVASGAQGFIEALTLADRL